MTSDVAAPSLESGIVMPWFRSEDWPRWKHLLADGHRLPPTYETWFHRVELVRRRLERDGRRVDRVIMDPEIFIGWCRARDLVPNAASGWRYAAETSAARPH